MIPRLRKPKCANGLQASTAMGLHRRGARFAPPVMPRNCRIGAGLRLAGEHGLAQFCDQFLVTVIRRHQGLGHEVKSVVIDIGRLAGRIRRPASSARREEYPNALVGQEAERACGGQRFVTVREIAGPAVATVPSGSTTLSSQAIPWRPSRARRSGHRLALNSAAVATR